MKSNHCLLGQVLFVLGLYRTKVSVSGSLSRSFARWVYFGISRIICMFIPPENIYCIFHEVTEIMSHGSVSARKLARVTGRIVACFFIMGDVCKLMTKALHRLIECRKSWDAQVQLDTDV